MAVVVCTVLGRERRFELPRSSLQDRRLISGGERSLYELAFAAAAAGYEVELRGSLSATMFRELRRAVDGPAPSVDLEPRRPRPDDTVIVPESWDVAGYAGPILSQARVIMMLLSPAGLCGPALTSTWTPPDPVVAPTEGVARPEVFRAIETAGFELWSNSAGTAEMAAVAGVRCTPLGTGSPLPRPPGRPRSHDLAVLEANRWRPLADIVAAQVDATCLRIGEHPGWTAIPELLSAARILVWPSRLEGNSRVQREARAVGTVPVVLPNAFTHGMAEEFGAVVVETLEEMPGAIRRLLDDRDHLAELSERASAWARREDDWRSYVARVDLALRRRPEPAAWTFRELAGDEIDRLAHDHGAALAHQAAEIAELRAALVGAAAEAQEARGAAASEVAQTAARAAEAEARAARIRAELDATRSALGQSELEAQRLQSLRHRVADRVTDAAWRVPMVHRTVRGGLAVASRLRRRGRRDQKRNPLD